LEQFADLKTPIISDEDLKNFDREKLMKGMQKEVASMKNFPVFKEKSVDEVLKMDPSTYQWIKSRWVHREKGDEVRSRFVAKGYD